MNGSKSLSPSPTELIDWMNDEGLLELDWDFPETGDLYQAGLDDSTLVDLLAAIDSEYGVELTAKEFKNAKVKTPVALSALIVSRLA